MLRVRLYRCMTQHEVRGEAISPMTGEFLLNLSEFAVRHTAFPTF